MSTFINYKTIIFYIDLIRFFIYTDYNNSKEVSVMTERIRKLTEKTVAGELFPECSAVEFDREDIFLSPTIMNAKHSAEYILAQTPYISELTALTGYLRFGGSAVMGEIFNRYGHENFKYLCKHFYNKPIEELCTFEWQHSVADFEKVIRIGIDGYKQEIAESMKRDRTKEELEFLTGLDMIADAIIGWAEKCADIAAQKAAETQNSEARDRLMKLSTALRKVPKKPAESFYEAILSVYVIYSFDADSIGTIDRYLFPFYQKDLESGILTEEEAKEYLQELFLMLQWRISPKSDRFYRGGESHFCIGGYTENGEDGFNALSHLIIEALMELPAWIPQISLRWTPKTPTETLRYVMDCERKDPNKRIAFVNDEPRIAAFMKHGGFPYELACKYTMVGCNEPQLPGGIFMGGMDINIAKSMEKTFTDYRNEIIAAPDFDAFYTIFEKALFETLGRCLLRYNQLQSIRARDNNLVSSMFFDGSIDRAKSITRGGAKNAMANMGAIGIVTVFDSLAIIRQFVYEEKRISMGTLADALDANWKGYEELLTKIKKDGCYFGNDDDISNECVKRFADSVTAYFANKTSDLGYHFLLGNLIGYNQHHTFFGNMLMATPDGRHAGEPISYGICQGGDRDREGLTALLSSIAKATQNTILCGSTVTNILFDEKLIKDDAHFEKTVKMMETYFRMGGLHFQPNYVSREILLDAQKNPDNHKTLRVRVSGFSDYFNYLNTDLQNEIVKRTEVKG